MNYLLIVKVPRGLVIRDTPRSQSQGAKNVRTAAVGAQLHATHIVKVEGVPYALLVSPTGRPEWVRVAEADGSIEYVDVIKLDQADNDPMVGAVLAVASALQRIAVRLIKDDEQ